MGYRRRRQITIQRVLAVLLAVSVIGLLLPTRLTGRLMNLVQVLVPFHDGATRLADNAGQALATEAPVPAEEHARLEQQVRALENRLASLSAHVDTLEQANRELAGLRDQALGPEGTLIPARVVAEDLLAWRESRLIDAGTLRGVRRGSAVTTQTPGLSVGSEDGVASGMAVLAAETLIGWVDDHVGTHTSRVRLLTDPESRMAVGIGRFEPERFTLVEADAPLVGPAEFWMVGAGDGRMKIIDVDHRYVDGESPAIAVDDLIISLPDDPALPAVLAIARVVEITRNAENPLLFTLLAEPTAPANTRRVYVLNTSY